MMPRPPKIRHPKHKNALQRRKKSTQLSLHPWLRSTGEGVIIPDGDGLPSLLSAAGKVDAVLICSQEASSTKDRIPGIVPNPNQGSPDIECDVRLETKVINTDGTTSAVTQSISKAQVIQAQKIIADARDKSEEKQKTTICDAIQLLYPYAPRDGQRDALHHLIYRREDLILIAKTSFGKSMILQAVSVLINKSISIVILPLDRIGQQQTSYIKQIGGRPCFLNADTISDKLLKDISSGKYTHILMSPELAVSERLRKTILEPKFKDRLALVVVDEAHLVSHWGVKFRTDYSRLNLLRTLIGPKIPWFACSATLDSKTLTDLIKGVGFDAGVQIQRTSINRPELVVRVGIIPKSKHRSYTALRFIFDSDPLPDNKSVIEPADIPKTIVFFNKKVDLHRAHEACLHYLERHDNHRYSRRQALGVVRVYTRNTHDEDKDRIIEELKKLVADSLIRVILATEALGIGVDLPDIRRVIQYGIVELPDIRRVIQYGIVELPAILWQRGGRASRDGKNGEIIFLLEPWVRGDRVNLSAKEQASLTSQDLEDILRDPDQEDNQDDSATKTTLPPRTTLPPTRRDIQMPSGEQDYQISGIRWATVRSVYGSCSWITFLNPRSIEMPPIKNDAAATAIQSTPWVI
jgi:hypothetical protein